MVKRSVLLLLFILLLSACSSSEEDSSSEEIGHSYNSNENARDNTTSETNIFPLTGIGTTDEGNNRVVGVMVNNSPEARPQTGLTEADIVFEMLTEGNITRLLALYQSDYPEVVGPVRSARVYYSNLAKDYGAIYVYHGAADFVDDMIKNSGVEFLNGKDYDDDGHLFIRESFRKAPHNSYLQFTAIPEVAKDTGYDMTAHYDPLPFLSEEERDNVSGDIANYVEVAYSKHSSELITYEYDEVEEVYNRFTGGQQTVEMHTDEPVQLANIFIIEAAHKVIDKEGRRTVDLSSGGDAYLLQQGKLQQIAWTNPNGAIVPNAGGKVVGFVPGKTWINVVPGLEAVTVIQE